MERNEITLTQVHWIIHALQTEMGAVRDEMDRSPDGSPICAIGEIILDGREALITKLNDIVESGMKTIRIRKRGG